MNKKVLFTILTWAALILSLRLMLFFLPVLIDRMARQQFSMSHPSDLSAVSAIIFAVVVLVITGKILVSKK